MWQHRECIWGSTGPSCKISSTHICLVSLVLTWHDSTAQHGQHATADNAVLPPDPTSQHAAANNLSKFFVQLPGG